MTTPRPAPAIIFDALRLFLGASARTPRGIDRVDFDYASNLIETWPGEIFLLLPTPWGLRLYDRAIGQAGLAYLAAHWHEQGDADHDPALDWVRRRLGGIDPGPRGRKRRRFGGLLRAIARQIGMMAAIGVSLGRSATRATPPGAIYLNISQLGYAAPLMVPWLRKRPDIRAVYLMHDVIPIETPEFVAPIGTRLALKMLDVVRRHADGLIFTTQAAAGAVQRALGAAQPSAMLTLGLPIAPVFLQAEPEDTNLRAERYFIVCGAIDVRKNHLLLLDVWRELYRRHGVHTPKLVVAGAASVAAAPILDALENCGPLRPYIILVSGLASPGMRRLMAHARALLLPSHAEGFGLPVIEALALGTPVVASDLPALREVAGAHGIFRSTDDRDGWAAAIEGLMDSAPPADFLALGQFQPMTAVPYFIAVHNFLLSLPAKTIP